ncbi:MAG: argininosuccinate lyase [Deltaproteobacteria bacterium]|nr:argininosuccinate lyase [Deltaproteobacteria bacterium]
MKIERLWGSRLKESPDEAFIEFISGRDVRERPPCDAVLVPYDIWGSRAHAVMLWKQGIVPTEDAQKIISGLHDVTSLYQQGAFPLDPAKEDVHTNIESFLIEKYGLGVGGKLHTARSRNDQVTLDMTLFLRDRNLDFCRHLIALETSLLAGATAYAAVLIPGYTHHQHAMVTTFGHILLSYAESFYRDLLRFRQWHSLFNANPLGGAASYGTSLPIDRELTSLLLGFEKPSVSSLDLITNRWEAEAELSHAISIMMNHLSGLAQTLILFTTTEFGFVTLSDKYCGGSSIMPQKRNPSGLEVIKAKTAVAHGVQSSLYALGKSLFVGYNRDSQWTKYLIMDLIHECEEAPHIMAAILDTLSIDRERAHDLCRTGFITATDLMEAIVNDYSLPLRQAKMLIERAVKYSEQKNTDTITWEGLKQALEEMGLALALTADSVINHQDPATVVSRRKAIGGPTSDVLLKAVDAVTARVREQSEWLQDKTARLDSAQARLDDLEKDLLSHKA